MKTRSTFTAKVIRRTRWWAVSTVVVLLILLGLGWAFLSLADDVSSQQVYLMLIGGMFIVLSFLLGQAVNSILVRSWDVWLNSLGPTQISVLVPELEKAKERLLKEENEK